jgi:uncharacterized repeat protein (TIGR03803 family)
MLLPWTPRLLPAILAFAVAGTVLVTSDTFAAPVVAPRSVAPARPVPPLQPVPPRLPAPLVPLGVPDIKTSETVLHAFMAGTDGRAPDAAVAADTHGDLFGATQSGGTSSCDGSFVGCGTVYELIPSGTTYTYKTILRFPASGALGATPQGALTIDSTGNLYGTTTQGGIGCTNLSQEVPGCGVVFRLAPSGAKYVETVLHKFDNNGKDGFNPYGDVLRNSAGVLKGTTAGGGSGLRGIVYELKPSGKTYTETILYAVKGPPSDGSQPESGLAMDSKGALYGTSYYGGANSKGAVYKLTPSGASYTEKLIHSFKGGSDGENPLAALAVTKAGAVFGTAPYGGGSEQLGIVFELAANTYTEKIVHAFKGVGASDGAHPYAGITQVGSAFYGTTQEGGSSSCILGCGEVFKLTPKSGGYVESLLYPFGSLPSQADGAYPEASVIARGAALFGTTSGGGAGEGTAGPGVVYKLAL